MRGNETITTEKYEETEVTATLSLRQLRSIDNVKDYLIKHHQFLPNLPINRTGNIQKESYTYTQRQLRIVKKPQDKYEYFKEMGQEYPDNIIIESPTNNKFLEEYLKYFYKQQSDNAKAKEDVKKAIEDFIDKNLMPKPEPEKLNPLKFFSPTDLT